MKAQLLKAASIVSTTALIAACSTARSAPTDDGPDAISVRTVPASELAHRIVSVASGVVQAQTSVDLAFQVPGKVIAVGPDEGSTVHAGDVLAVIDPMDYRLAVDQATAQAEHAVSDRDRYKPLVAAGSIAASDFDRIESAARQATAAAGLARKHLADTRLVAPMSGIIARRAIERGGTAAPGQTVFTLMDVDPVRVRVGIPEAEIGSIHNGQAAEISLPALSDEKFTGRVTLVGIAADPSTRTYAVEISVPNPLHRLKVGMVAESRIDLGGQARAVTVPAGAVVRDENGVSVVYVLDPAAHRAYARRVDLGDGQGDAIQVVSGLKTGDQVIVAGQHRLRDGSRVVMAGSTSTSPTAGGAQ